MESAGQATAEARARAEASKIEAIGAVKQAELRAKALRIEFESKQQLLAVTREAELSQARTPAQVYPPRNRCTSDT